MTRRIILFGLLCFVGVPLLGTTAIAEDGERGSGHGIASMTVLGLVLGQADLGSVQKKLGEAKMWSDGDASTSESKVCYATQNSAPIVVVFASNTEMAGPPENTVTDIRIFPASGYQERSNCRSIHLSGKEVSTKSGLRLGINKGSTRKILGAAARVEGSAWSYLWSVERLLPISDKNYGYWVARKQQCFGGRAPFFTISSEIKVQFDGDLVGGLSLRRIESIC